MADQEEIHIESDRLQLLLNNAFQKADAKSKGKLTRAELKRAIALFAEEAKVPSASDDLIESSIRSAITSKRGTVDPSYFTSIIESLYQVKLAPSPASDGTPKSQGTSAPSGEESQPSTEKPEPVTRKGTEQNSKPSQSSTSQAPEETKFASQESPADQTSPPLKAVSEEHSKPQLELSTQTEELKAKPAEHSNPEIAVPTSMEHSKTAAVEPSSKSDCVTVQAQEGGNKHGADLKTSDSRVATAPTTKRASEVSGPENLEDITKDQSEISESSCQESTSNSRLEVMRYEPKSTETYEDIYKLANERHLSHSVSDLTKEVEKPSDTSSSTLTSHRSLPSCMEKLADFEDNISETQKTDSKPSEALKDLDEPSHDSKDAGKDFKYLISFSIPYDTTVTFT
jgi:hypothetical protein